MEEHINHVIHASLGTIDNPEEVYKSLEEGAFLQHALGITDQQIYDYYEYAVELFNQNRLSDAKDVILVINLLNPFIYNCWVALGLIEYREKAYQEFYIAFQVAFSLEPENPLAYLEYSKCIAEMDTPNSGLATLDIMNEIVPDTPENEHAFQEAKLIKESIIKRIGDLDGQA